MQRYKDNNLASSIIHTLAYSDIFDYPLTLEEVNEFLIADTKVRIDTIRKTLLILADPSTGSGQVSKQVYTDGGFYFLKGREKIVELRRKRAEWSRKKLEIAQKTADKLKVIPSIKMIGVTGALAMENCKEDDDIDLLIITTKNSLWLTRFLIIVLCPILGIKRRKPKEENTKDRICFNLFLDENHLGIEPENLFLAHEVVQVKPVINRKQTYEKLLTDNHWARRFLPNAVKETRYPDNKIATHQNTCLISQYLNILKSFLDILAFKLQYLYMKQKITCEKVNLHQAFFHPADISKKIVSEYEKRLKLLDLDKLGEVSI